FHATAAVRGDTLPVFRPEDLRGPATGTAPAETSPAGAPGPLPAATPGAEVGGPEPVPPPAPPLWPAAVTPLRPAHRRATGAARLSSPASPLHAAVAADPIAAAEERPTSTLDNSPDAAAKEAKAGEAPSALRDDESATAAGVAAGAVPASLFGTTPAAPATVSVFGTMPAAPAAASVFGTMPAAPAAASVFGTMPAAPATASVFGTMPAAPGAAAARATVAAGARPQPGEIHGRAGRGRRRFAAAAAAGIGIAALAAAVVLLRHPGGERRAAPAAHRRAAAAGALSAAAPRPVAGPTAARPAGTTAPAGGQPALGPHLKAAEDLLAGGDAASARRELALVSAQEQAAFSPEARATYDRLAAALAADRRRQIGADLASALRRGDMRRISAALTAAKWEPDLPAATRRDLDRARQAIDLDARLARSDLGQAPQEALRNATDLLTLVPRHRRAGELRDQAAKAIEDQADAALAGGDGQRAAALLDGLRQAWPDRSGLKDRFDRLEAQRRNDGQLESVLAAASRAEAASQPLQGLELLAGVNPGGRYRERFRRQRERLEALLARLDAAPPSITLRPGFKLEYDKGARIAVPLRITDDLAVKSAEAWVRPEGATSYQAVPVRHLSGADYEVDIPPELHQNRGVELYAAAGDNSGHKSLLGSREQPLKLKRRTWIEKLFTGKEGARPEGGAGGGTGPTGSSGTGLTGFLW
ncbi:MAG TPA: nucleoporin, partial [Thermoanaerobaculia bacterium]|nr:nucleoporin [Thermoanaerobaculia bacterium]